jgi:hypothetical protein
VQPDWCGLEFLSVLVPAAEGLTRTSVPPWRMQVILSTTPQREWVPTLEVPIYLQQMAGHFRQLGPLIRGQRHAIGTPLVSRVELKTKLVPRVLKSLDGSVVPLFKR